MERKLLSIVETLKEFRNILLGQQIIVHTDHKNLTCKNFDTERVMRWCLVLEEYGPELRYIPGEHNIVADALSRLGMIDNPISTGNQMAPEEVADLFAADEDDHEMMFPLSYFNIHASQEEDEQLQGLYEEKPEVYSKTDYTFGDAMYNLITRDNRIVIPQVLQRPGVKWYHELLMHPGATRTELTKGQHFIWKGMRKTIEDVCKRCGMCQMTKPKLRRRLGHLPPKTPEEIPWERLCIDLIGPYSVGNAKKNDDTELRCLTMIDPVTGWFEIAQIFKKQADHVANALELNWLNRYPRPAEVILDRGTEFQA
jgi:Integrase zinc binding domain/RNase H-like domain found in reverse transcriptase